MKHLLGILGALAVLTACGADGSSANAAKDTPPLRTAYDACAKSQQKYLTKAFHADAPYVTDELNYQDGSVLITTPDPQGDLLSAAAYQAAKCILDQTSAPPSVAQAMGSSTALSGRQHQKYAKINVGWSFNGSSPSSFEATFDPVS